VAGKGLARQVKRARGKPTWEVHETADRGVAAVKFPEQIGTDLRHATEAARKVALFRRSVLMRWEKAIAAAIQLGYSRDAGTGRFLQQLLIDEGHEIGRATLYNWETRWRRGGLAGLLDGRSVLAKGEKPAEDPFLAEVQRHYLTIKRPTLTRCHEYASLAAKEHGWPVRSYKAAQRHVAKIPAAVVLKMRGGRRRT
jgi:transposase